MDVRGFKYLLVLGFVASIAYVMRLNLQQSLSVLFLGGMIGATLMFWRYRLVFAFFALSLMLATNLLEVKLLIEYAHLDTIIFLASMMVVVGYLEEARFFEVLIDRVLVAVGGRPKLLIIFFMMVSGLLAALVDEVTSILIMTAVLLDFTSRYNLDPVRFIMMSIFATNIGSSATVVGNPVGVLIAFEAGLGFSEFLRWATPIAILALLLSIGIILMWLKTDMTRLQQLMAKEALASTRDIRTNGGEEIDIRVPAIIFAATITGLVLHTPIEEALGLGKNVMLLGTPIFFAGVVLFLERERARELVERRIDWWTLLFFMIFFASVGTLSHTGTTDVIAQVIINNVGTSLEPLVVVVMFAAGLMSAFMDNVLSVATWIPIIQTLEQYGVNTFPLWWTMLFAGTFWGNLTVIGSTANIVAVGMLERRERIHISFRQWIGIGAAVTIPTMLLALLLLVLQLPLMA
ncbi:MAG: SLC13 family permease [Candidatus Caldarchaeum sp.]|nr:SLC13 family permease [Candidatus Caldarchaeum sp.]MDW8435127.1 SLC13 family permease [Candidatus Caldarchaeum sp.]